MNSNELINMPTRLDFGREETYTAASDLCLKRKIPSMPNQLPYFRLYMEVSKVEFCLPLKTGSVLLGDISFAPSLKAKQYSNEFQTMFPGVYRHLIR